MEYIWIIIEDRAGLGLDGLGLGWATERDSGCICSTCVNWGPSVAMDTNQVIDLLSWAHTCLWEREDLLLSCHGFRLFSDWLLWWIVGYRSKHYTEAGPQVLGAWSPSLDRDLDPLIGVERVIGLACTWGTSEACIFSGFPAGLHWFMNCHFYVTVWLGYGLAP
jgi:hypothetical protein